MRLPGKNIEQTIKALRGSVIPVLCIPLWWASIFSSNIFAQDNIKVADSFIKEYVEQDKVSQWGPLIARKQVMDQAASEIDFKDLQALSYLQGYTAAPLLKGVTVYDKHKSFPGYNLFLSANAPGATLMDMNGTTVHQWRFPYSSLPSYHGYYDPNWCRVRILKNGDLMALISFGGLLKIDKNSHLIWFRRLICHHDFDIDDSGNIYTFTVKNSKLGDTAGIKIDSITVLAPNGTVKKEISLYDLFKKYPDPAYINKINELGRFKGSFYTRDGRKIYLFVPGDAFHSNSIQVLDGKWAFKIPAFKKGNLLISILRLGVIICVDPDKEKIVWLMDKAFWNRGGQHFARLLDNGHVLLFENSYRPDFSRIVEFDPAARKIIWDYSGQNGRFSSSYLGQCYRLPNGNTLITESTNGHSFEVTPDKKIVWEFYNPNQADKNSSLIDTHQIRPLHGRYDKLIAVIYQMQRIALDSHLDWLKD